MIYMTLEQLSEEFRKYLISIEFEGKSYYTVSGADLSDNEDDKILINSSQEIIAFKEIESLVKYVDNSKYIFDQENLRKWTRYLSKSSQPYTNISFDILSNISDLENYTDIRSVYVSLGFLMDYAIQTNDDEMLNILNSVELSSFKDSSADFFLWKGTDEFTLEINKAKLLLLLRQLFQRIKVKIIIQ